MGEVFFMDKEWLEQIATRIEEKYGVETRNRVFGDINEVSGEFTSACEFFHHFVIEMDRIDDKDFLVSVMSECCPCYHRDLEENIKKNYEES